MPEQNFRDILQNRLIEIQEKTNNFLGYPVSKDFDYSELMPFLFYPLNNLGDPFVDSTYAVDSRDYQLIQPNWQKINDFGAKVLCLEKIRPYVPLERAIMAIRFSDEVFGTQFHPEADSEGMMHNFKQEEKMLAVIKEYGSEKYEEMIDRLDDPDKIMLTEAVIIPTFLRKAAENILEMA